MTTSQTLSSKQNAHEAVRKIKNALLTNPEQIRERYRGKPIQLMRLLEPSLRFPKVIRVLFAMLWLEQDLNGKKATRFIVKGPRGGGKSKLLGSIGFAKWFLQTRNIVDMGGSLAQAKGVYNYFSDHCYSHASVFEHMPKEPTMQLSESDAGNYFKAVAASAKAVRGPHPDCLFIDEAVETNDEIILSAMPMVNTSQTPLLVMTSTFHKIFGIFQETWDNADERGYVRYSWDIIDVCLPFSLDIFKDERLIREIPDLTIEQAGEKSLEWRIKGRTGDEEGWVPFDSVVQAWREKSTLDWFDIEYMGSRPSAAGLVLDPEDVDACTIDERVEYVQGADTTGGLDWGFSGQTAWTPFMRGRDDIKYQLENRTYTQVRSGVIIEDIVEDVVKYRITVIYADGSHPFENADLRAALAKRLYDASFKCTVVEVAFGKDKDHMIGNYRTHFQNRKMAIPEEFQIGIWQHKRYRYQPGTDKPMKKDDHIPDATMLALKRWPLIKSVGSKIPMKTKDEQATSERKSSSTTAGSLLDELF